MLLLLHQETFNVTANTLLSHLKLLQPHHTRLAVVGRNDTDAKVELFVADGDLDPPIGGASLFRYVDFGQDLDTGDDG